MSSSLKQLPGTIAATLGIEFSLSADGFPVARTGDLVMAMITVTSGSFLASAVFVRRPLCELKRADFHRHEGGLANEAAFIARVIETAGHQRDLADLARVQTHIACSTPWGSSQMATIYASGVVSHTTSGHGGFHLSRVRNLCVPSVLRNDTCWYEEDVEWAAVTHTFPKFFTRYERRTADEIIRHTWPRVWETVHGRQLANGESRGKDRLAFESEHSKHWIVTSAILSDHQAGMTEVVARRGTERTIGEIERRYLVDSAEYANRRPFGFVIDEARHRLYDGPSSFVGRRCSSA